MQLVEGNTPEQQWQCIQGCSHANELVRPPSSRCPDAPLQLRAKCGVWMLRRRWFWLAFVFKASMLQAGPLWLSEYNTRRFSIWAANPAHRRLTWVVCRLGLGSHRRGGASILQGVGTTGGGHHAAQRPSAGLRGGVPEAWAGHA